MCLSASGASSALSKLLADESYLFQPRDDVYGNYDASYLQQGGPKNATQSPVVTGTSVIAIKFKDGVVMAADNLGMPPVSPSKTISR